MKVVYENQVKGIGCLVDEFKDGDMFILFGDNAPEEIKDYCYQVSVNPINGTIAAGQILKIGALEYPITSVGWEAPHTLAGLGHCTIKFSGDKEPEVPGTIYVGPASVPEITVGTVIQIIEN